MTATSQEDRKIIECLEYLIWKSEDADNFSRQCIVWLLRQRILHGEDVCTHLLYAQHDKDLFQDIQCMKDPKNTTHIDALFRLANLPYLLSCHEGGFEGNAFNPHAQCFTVWISEKPHANEVKRLNPNFDEIRAIHCPYEPRALYFK